MKFFNFGKSLKAFSVVIFFTVSASTPLILAMYSHETAMFDGTFRTCK